MLQKELNKTLNKEDKTVDKNQDNISRSQQVDSNRNQDQATN